MTRETVIDLKTSALLLMDFQGFVLENFLPAAVAEAVVAEAGALLAAARAAGLPVLHVTVGFRPGYPEISPRNALFSFLKESGLVAPGSAGTRIHPSLMPRAEEPVVTKHRIGAFSGTDLERILRAQGIETLILAGVITSGVVLSTLRQAFDLDYRAIVVADACADNDTATHAALMDKIFPAQAQILPAREIAARLTGSGRETG